MIVKFAITKKMKNFYDAITGKNIEQSHIHHH